ncbi:MAG: hypothetical protein IJT98_08005 [Prevotella sp.]|nr:hypothetical protein [Prevotella sp.]
MKKIFTLIALALTAIGVNAQDWNASNAESLANGTRILNNDFVQINTAVQDTEAAEIKDENDNADPKTFGGYTFTKYVNIRVDGAPAADNNWEGTAYGDADPAGISLIVKAKQNTDVTLYYKHGDGKAVSCIDQTTGKSVPVAETAVEGLDHYYIGIVKILEGHTYTIYAKGGTTGLSGISTAATPAAEEITNGTDVSVTWTMADPETILSTSTVPAAISDANVTLGDGIVYQGTVLWNEIGFTKLQPVSDDKGKNEYANAKSMNKYIDFQITPVGKYQITKVEFDVIKIGTGDPTIFVDLIEGDGTANTIGDNVAIRRNNDSETTDIHQTYEAKTKVSDQPVSLRIYVGKLANNKQIGIANVVITGVIDSDDLAAGIANINAAAQQSGTRYNIAGQQVDASYKGVVVVNGQKMLQK